MANDKSPETLGLCETFLGPNISDQHVGIDGYDMIRKDRTETQNKTGGGLKFYFRNTLKFKRRPEYKISKFETIWTEIELSNAKASLLCSVYRSSSAQAEWIDLSEEKSSIAHVTGTRIYI